MIKKLLTALAVSGGLALAAPAAQALAMPVPAVLPASPAAVMAPEAVLMPGTTVTYPAVLPAPVTHVTTAVGKATVSWAAIAGAAVYEVRAVPAGSGATTRVDHVTSAHSLTVTLHPGRYVVNVRAGRSASDIHGHWSASRYFTVAAPVSSRAVRAMNWALTRIGDPYVWAAAGPNAFDCSGLVKWSYQQIGVYLPHMASMQYEYGTHVSRASLRPGDLVFFYPGIGHVGIYVGNGKMVDAPHRGANVRIDSIDWANYVGATRL